MNADEKRELTKQAIDLLKRDEHKFCCNAMLHAMGHNFVIFNFRATDLILLEKLKKEQKLNEFPEFLEMIARVAKTVDSSRCYMFGDPWRTASWCSLRAQKFRVEKMEEFLETLK